MAAFSYQHPPFLVDSVFSQNATLKTPSFTDEFFPNLNQFYPFSGQQSLFHQEGSSVMDASVLESSCVEQQSSKNEPSVTEKQRTESLASLAEKSESEEQVTQTSIPVDKKRKTRNGSSPNSANSKDASKQGKCKKQKSEKEAMKDVKNEKKDNKNEASEEAPKGYIHVRARRGQATDSHSLAERVRREKISERMKTLQALVPGCDKVTGKALMLDEIINYVQSLQNQVEFLSMKLASLDPMVYTFGLMDLDVMAFAGTEGINNSMGLPTMPQLIQSTTSSTTSGGAAQPPLAFADTNTIGGTTTTASTTTSATTTFPCPLVDSSPSLLQQEHKQILLPSQEGRSSYWGVLDEQQRLSIINQFGFGANNLCSFQ